MQAHRGLDKVLQFHEIGSTTARTCAASQPVLTPYKLLEIERTRFGGGRADTRAVQTCPCLEPLFPTGGNASRHTATPVEAKPYGVLRGSSQGWLPARTDSPFAGRDTHPLDDGQPFMKASPPPIPIDPHCLVALICLYSHPRAGRSWCPVDASRSDNEKGGSHALLRPCPPSTLLDVEHGAQFARSDALGHLHYLAD
jgi:hypothetical protein